MSFSAASLLLRRDAILDAVSRVADVMATGTWEQRVPAALALLGEATGVSRVYIFDVTTGPTGRGVANQRFEWVAEGVEPQIDVPDLQGIDLIDAGFSRWSEELSAGRTVFGDPEDFPESERPLLEMQQILSILIQPIFSGDRWWGFMGFDACATPHSWSKVESDTLRIAARTIGAAIHRQHRDLEMRRRVELLSEVVIDTDAAGIIRYVNPAWAGLLGHAPAGAVGLPLSGFIHPDDVPVLSEHLHQALSAPATIGADMRMVAADGTLRWVILSMAPLPEGGIVCAARDITTRREREAAVAASRAKSDFLASMSHELRTPLNAILGLSYLAGQGDLPEAQADYLRKIDRAGRGLLAIINDVLDLSKIEANAMTLELRPFSLAASIASVESVLLPLVRKRGLAWSVTVDSDVPTHCIGDALRLEQILVNLAANAVKFTEAGSVTLRVALQELKGERATLRFEVVDSGIGMTPEQAAHVFESYRQGDRGTARRYGGTGLGLSISRHLVEAMGGTISVRTALGAGSTFTVTVSFDCASPERRENDARTPHHGESVIAMPVDGLLRGCRILVAEDNEFNQEIFQTIIGQAGADVVVVSDGTHAVTAWREHGPFDLVLMDIQMTEMDGPEATQMIRKLERGSAHVPIIALSASVTPEDRELCRLAGMDDFVAKPIVPDALISRLASWLHNPSQPPRGTSAPN